jgi:hypothetical protein
VAQKLNRAVKGAFKAPDVDFAQAAAIVFSKVHGRIESSGGF